MKEHIRLGRLFGIAIGVNASVVVIAALLAWSLATSLLPEVVPGGSALAYWSTALAVTIAFFGSLVAHELAHALVAQHHGIGVERITLWLLGGVSRLSGDVRAPSDELRMAGAGPATSLALGALALVAGAVAAAAGLPDLLVAAIAWLATVNVILGVFNLMPAFPLDGGRVLRALLWQHDRDRLQATVAAARAGTGFAYVLFGLGLLSLLSGFTLNGVWFWVLGLFVMNAAQAELTSTVEQQLLADVPVSAVMTPDPVTVTGDVTVADLVDRYVLHLRHSAYPVVDADGRATGLMSLAELRSVPPAHRASTAVGATARPLRTVVTGTPTEPIIELLRRMTDAGASRALVVDHGLLAGLVSLSDIARAIDARALARGISAHQ